MELANKRTVAEQEAAAESRSELRSERKLVAALQRKLQAASTTTHSQAAASEAKLRAAQTAANLATKEATRRADEASLRLRRLQNELLMTHRAKLRDVGRRAHAAVWESLLLAFQNNRDEAELHERGEVHAEEEAAAAALVSNALAASAKEGEGRAASPSAFDRLIEEANGVEEHDADASKEEEEGSDVLVSSPPRLAVPLCDEDAGPQSPISPSGRRRRSALVSIPPIGINVHSVRTVYSHAVEEDEADDADEAAEVSRIASGAEARWVGLLLEAAEEVGHEELPSHEIVITLAAWLSFLERACDEDEDDSSGEGEIDDEHQTLDFDFESVYAVVVMMLHAGVARVEVEHDRARDFAHNALRRASESHAELRVRLSIEHEKAELAETQLVAAAAETDVAVARAAETAAATARVQIKETRDALRAAQLSHLHSAAFHAFESLWRATASTARLLSGECSESQPSSPSGGGRESPLRTHDGHGETIVAHAAMHEGSLASAADMFDAIEMIDDMSAARGRIRVAAFAAFAFAGKYGAAAKARAENAAVLVSMAAADVMLFERESGDDTAVDAGDLFDTIEDAAEDGEVTSDASGGAKVSRAVVGCLLKKRSMIHHAGTMHARAAKNEVLTLEAVSKCFADAPWLPFFRSLFSSDGNESGFAAASSDGDGDDEKLGAVAAAADDDDDDDDDWGPTLAAEDDDGDEDDDDDDDDDDLPPPPLSIASSTMSCPSFLEAVHRACISNASPPTDESDADVDPDAAAEEGIVIADACAQLQRMLSDGGDFHSVEQKSRRKDVELKVKRADSSRTELVRQLEAERARANIATVELQRQREAALDARAEVVALRATSPRGYRSPRGRSGVEGEEEEEEEEEGGGSTTPSARSRFRHIRTQISSARAITRTLAVHTGDATGEMDASAEAEVAAFTPTLRRKLSRKPSESMEQLEERLASREEKLIQHILRSTLLSIRNSGLNMGWNAWVQTAADLKHMRDTRARHVKSVISNVQMRWHRALVGPLWTRWRTAVVTERNVDLMKTHMEAQLAEKSAELAEQERKHAHAGGSIEQRSELVKEELQSEVEKLYGVIGMVRAKMVDLNGSLRVICRCRPMLSRDAGTVAVRTERDTIAVVDSERSGPAHTTKFTFDNVLGPTQGQAEMFSAVEDVALSVLEMHNVCVFAYGSTGSGKTYSMQGPPSVVSGDADVSEWGLYPRIVDAIFAAIAQREASDVGLYTVSMRIADNYLNEVNDLLQDDVMRRNVTSSVERGDPFSDFQHVALTGRADFMSHLENFSERRVTAVATHNASSRSHMVLSLLITETTSGKTSQLQLVDLAGSESYADVEKANRTAEPEEQSRRKRECVAINQSLSVLKRVMETLAANQHKDDLRVRKSAHAARTPGKKIRSVPKDARPPWREAKLTLLLKSSLQAEAGESSTTFSSLSLFSLTPLLTSHVCISSSSSSIRVGSKPKILMICCVPPNSALSKCTKRALKFAKECAKVKVGMNAAQRVAAAAKVKQLQSADERARAAITLIEERLASADPKSGRFNKRLKLKKAQIKWCDESVAVVSENEALLEAISIEIAELTK